jgi:tRNA modification GTPase
MTGDQTTIVACATGWAYSPRALIRLSGPDTHDLCVRLLEQLPPAPGPTPGGTIISTSFMLAPNLRVPCFAMRFDAPRSYTGEDSIELVLPGNPHLLERVIARLTTEPGIREAGPGEFSARAFFNGKLTLEQAEGVAATIAATSEDDLAAADDLLEGRTGARYRAWTDDLAALLALVEAGIDFTDQEDVVPIAPAALAHRLDALIGTLRAHVGSRTGAERESTLPVAVLVGEPNAGKSTLFNALLARQRSIISPIAHTTRDAIAEPLNLRSDTGIPDADSTIMLVDLAGLDDRVNTGTGALAQQVALEAIRRADIIIWCDSTGRFREGLLPASARERARPILRIHTKADLAAPGTLTADVLNVCAIDGWNLGPLKRALADAALDRAANVHARSTSNAARLLPRHRGTLGTALAYLEAARATLGEHPAAAHALTHPELTAGALRSALDALGELIGDISPDDIIGRIFATFCVGK